MAIAYLKKSTIHEHTATSKLTGETHVVHEHQDSRHAAELWSYPNQEIKSADTSINVSKLPATFTKVKWSPGTINADIGGGRFDNATRYLESQGVTNHIYDPFNRSKDHNEKSSMAIRNGQADTATVNNVLNVIKEGHIRDHVIKQAADAIKPDGTAYFLIHEGDGSSQSRVTKVVGGEAKSWQEHRKASSYIPEIRKHFLDVKTRGNMIIAREPLKKRIVKAFIRKSKESRFVDELIDAADSLGPDFADYIEELEDSGELKEMLPEVHRLKKFPMDPSDHPDNNVFDHTMEVIRSHKDGDPDPAINLGCLFHDIGKAETMEINDEAQPHYPHHEEAGLKIFKDIAHRLDMPAPLARAVALCVRCHGDVHDMVREPEMFSDERMKILTDDLDFETLIAMTKCDAKASAGDEGIDKDKWDAFEKRAKRVDKSIIHQHAPHTSTGKEFIIQEHQDKPEPASKAYLRFNLSTNRIAKGMSDDCSRGNIPRIRRYKEVVGAWRTRTGGTEKMPVYIKAMQDAIDWHERHFGRVE